MSAFCPNKNTAEFVEMANTLGSAIAESVWYENQGHPIWETNKGVPSPLWNEIMSNPGVTRGAAIAYKSHMYRNDFIPASSYRGEKSEPTAKQLFDFINNDIAKKESKQLYKDFNLVDKKDPNKPIKWARTDANFKKVTDIARKINTGNAAKAKVIPLAIGAKEYYTIILTPGVSEFKNEEGKTTAHYDAASGAITFSEEGLTAETVIHEFSHPFIDAIVKTNPALFNNLISQINQDKSNPVMANIFNHIEANYANASELTKNKELLAYTISEYGKGNIDLTTGTNTKSAIKAFYEWVSGLIQDLKSTIDSNGRVAVDRIHPNTKYQDLANFFTVYSEVGSIDLQATPIKKEAASISDEDHLAALLAFAETESTEENNSDTLPPAYKSIPTSERKSEDIKDEAAHISSLLPKAIAVDITSDYIKLLSGGRGVVGQFENGIISLMQSAPAGTAYHEGFHAVFRTLLSKKEQAALIADVKKTTTNPTEKELFALEVEFGIDTAAATTLYYEEAMADMFADYMQDSLYNASTGIRGFFARIANWIKNVFVNVSTTKALFRNIESGTYKNSTPNTVRGVAYKVRPGMDVYEVQTTTRELVSLAFPEISTIEDIENSPVDFKLIEPRLRARLVEVAKSGDIKLATRISKLFTNGTTNLDSFWFQEMDSYMQQSLGLERKQQEEAEAFIDPESISDDRSLILTSSYNVSGKSKASASVKFLVAMTQQTEVVDGVMQLKQSELTGLPQLVDYATTYNDLENLLSGVVGNYQGGVAEDAFLKMVDLIKAQAKYKPELFALADKLTSLPAKIQTQFFGAFSRQKGGYVDHLVKGKPGPTITSIVTNSNTGTKDAVIRDNWAAAFAHKFGVYEGSTLVYNSAKIADFFEKRGAFMNHVDSLDAEAGVTELTKKKFNSLMATLGVTLNPNTLQFIIDNNLPNNPSVTKEVNEQEAFVENVVGPLISGTDALFNYTGELSQKTNFIKNEDTLFKKLLGASEAYFKKVSGENSFLGPDGNQIWPYQDNDMTSKTVSQFKQGDLTQLELLARSPYGENSIFLQQLLKPGLEGEMARDNFSLALYGNVKDLETRGDKGDKASALKPSDAYMDNFNKQMQGFFIGLAEADKGQQTYVSGMPLTRANLISVTGKDSWSTANPKAMQVLKGYLADEMNTMKVAESVLETKPESEWTIYYHYYPVAPGTGTHGVKKDKVKGNVFNSFLFPSVDLQKLGLQSPDGTILARNDENFTNNQDLNQLIKKAFYKLVKKELQLAEDNQLITKKANGSYENRLIDSSVIADYTVGESTDFTAIVADYTLNSIIGSVEQTKLFLGSPALFKVKGTDKLNHPDTTKRTKWADLNHFGDFMKRVPAAFASGTDFRVFNDSFGAPVVPTHYSSATVENVEVASSYFGSYSPEGKVMFNEQSIKEVSDLTGVSKEEVKSLFKPYLEINQTDAQAWITLDTYKERMHGLGKWTPAHDIAYEQAVSGKSISVSNIRLLAQPLKTVHSELAPTVNGEMILHYNKQSEAVLLPFMKDTSLGGLMSAMEREGVGHVIVLDGKKVGGSGIAKITDEQGNLLSSADIKLNSVDLRYNNLFLQQDLTPHGIGSTLFASQTSKNALGTVQLKDTYFDGEVTGEEAEAMYHEVVGELSDRGLVSFDESVGYDSDTKQFTKDSDGRKAIYKMLQKEFKGEISENHMEALNANIPLDSLPIRGKIANKLQALISKSTVKLQQQGGAFIQMTDLGFIGKEASVADSVKNNIIWFGNPAERLKAMHVEDGKVKPAQILLPYAKLVELIELKGNDVLKNKFGKDKVKDLTSVELQQLMDPAVLEGFSYRIPNQGPSSNDAFVIAGVLPAEMGDTIVMFSDVTQKTGSDFDIDKMFIVMPSIYFSKDKGRVVRAEYDMNDVSKTRTEGLQNLRLDLIRQFILHPKAYIDVMAPLDDPWLENLSADLFPATVKMAPFEFFMGSSQLKVKSTFDNAKSLVGSIANHASHHAMSISSDLSFNDYYLGVGNKVEGQSTISQKEDVDGRSISSTLGVYMNAIVDAAKDPFISRANLNHFTAGTTFMLARAGVNREWTAAFIGQPILKDLVAKQASMEGRFSEKVWDDVNKRYPTALELVLADYGMGSITEQQFRQGLPTGFDETYDKAKSHQMRKDKESSIKVTFAQLANNIQNPNMESDNFKLDQLGVLKQFIEWQGKAGDLNQLLRVSKVDVEGATKSLLGARMATNLLRSTLGSESIDNVEKLLGISSNRGVLNFNKGKDATMTSRYFENSVMASIERFSPLFVTSSDAALEVVESLLSRTGNGGLIQREGIEQLAQGILNEVYAMAATDTTAFNKTQEELHELLFGSENILSLAERLRIAKNDVSTNNLFLDSLDIRVGRDGSPDNIMMPNNESVLETKEVMFASWDELLGNPQTKKLAEDLISYSFYKSGFSKTIGDFSEHIPNRYMEANDFHKDIEIKNREFTDAFSLVGTNGSDQIVKHMYADNKLVPRVGDKQITLMKYTGEGQYVVDEEHGFILDATAGGNIKFTDEFDYTTYAPFIKKKVGTSFDPFGIAIKFQERLYKYMGDTRSGEPVYIRTNTLGKTGQANNIKEYIGDGKTSIFEENNVSLPTYLQRLTANLTNEKDLATRDVDESLEKDNADDRLLFCAI